jgi:2-polyprenyl-3-methyl-5-hydroxy-6-metoxy-1,4-benzoquinol methylase
VTGVVVDALRDEVGRVRAWYNLVADTFVRRYEGASGWYLARCEEDLLHAVCPCEGRDVLDLGTGAGRLLPRLGTVARRVVAADVAEALLARVPRTAAGLVQMDAAQSAIRPESFDVVICLGLFEYVRDLDRFLSEITSMLRPGGRLALTYHQIAAYRRPVDEPPEAGYFGRTVAERSRYWVKRRHRRREIRAALGRAGFTHVRAYRLFFRLPQLLLALAERVPERSRRRALLRRSVPALEACLARGLRPLTQLSTGNVLVVAVRGETTMSNRSRGDRR